jgi:hypothetical protein
VLFRLIRLIFFFRVRINIHDLIFHYLLGN